MTTIGTPPETDTPADADPARVRPAGGRVLTAASTQVELRTRGGIGRVDWNEVVAADPAFAGRFRLLSGRAPPSRSEVLVTPELLERTGGAIGETLVVHGAQPLTWRQVLALNEQGISAYDRDIVSSPPRRPPRCRSTPRVTPPPRPTPSRTGGRRGCSRRAAW